MKVMCLASGSMELNCLLVEDERRKNLEMEHSLVS